MTSAAARDPNGELLDRALAQRVLREHLASFYASRNVSVATHIGFAIALGVATFERSSVLALLWLGLVVIIDLAVLLAPRWHAGIPDAMSATWARRYAAQVTLLSVVAAPVPAFFMARDDLVTTTLLVVVIMSGWTRSMQSLCSLKPALFGYGIPMMAGLVLALAWQGDGVHLFLAVFGAVHLVLTLRIATRQHRVLDEALRLRFRNEVLAARLGEQVVATERASQEKSRFLGTASHDLRQPLHAIALFGAALENELRNRPEGRNAERLMRAVHALGHSLDTMLDVSRLDAGVVAPALDAVPLDALFLPLNHTFSAQAEQRQLQLRVRASGLWVRSDPQLLHRMLSNLMDNALKYTWRGGVTVIARDRGEVVWIEVRDTGIGIAPEQSGRIFEEFYQIDNPGRDRSRGLGIGLAIVQRLSRLLGHPVQVHSRLGRGTHVRVVVPAAPARDEACAPAAAAAPPWRQSFTPAPSFGPRAPMPRMEPMPRRVLLVDDEADIRDAMTGLLRQHAIDLHAVADEAAAAQALERAGAEGRPYDLLLCDYRLADGSDGLDAGLRLRRSQGGRLPLLLVTGETAPPRLQRVRESGVPVLFKPVVEESLLRAMAALWTEAERGGT
jgi:signal transduction histidine kinase/CheY-like chemotaxis protein